MDQLAVHPSLYSTVTGESVPWLRRKTPQQLTDFSPDTDFEENDQQKSRHYSAFELLVLSVNLCEPFVKRQLSGVYTVCGWD